MKQMYQAVGAWVIGILIVVAGCAALAYFLESKAAPSGAVSVSGQAVPIGAQARDSGEQFVEGRAYNASSWLTERCMAGHQFIVSDHGRTVVQIKGSGGGGIKCQK